MKNIVTYYPKQWYGFYEKKHIFRFRGTCASASSLEFLISWKIR